MKRWEIINQLIQKYNYKSYLEIGTQHGNCFTEVKCERKVCVDPVKAFNELTYEMTSDEYFKNYDEKFDIIFIDGLHTEDQTIKDITKALVVLNQNGTIVAHDCLPDTREATGMHFCGTSYMAPIWYRMHITNVEVKVVDTDCGCGLFKPGTNELYTKVNYQEAREFNYFNANKQELVNVITVEQFNSIYSI
jgi:Methyltransferase domain